MITLITDWYSKVFMYRILQYKLINMLYLYRILMFQRQNSSFTAQMQLC